MFIGSLGPWELAIIFLIVLILFGGKKLPGVARSIGSAITEFKKGISGASVSLDESEKQEKEDTKKKDK
ncbi:MAG: twin-arginine translocase TatA/TatE family subunit [Spirochaetia bacterium]|nr:twin-arginine translocase TatA/TatE family subunit [Spirochaetia bacterium]